MSTFILRLWKPESDPLGKAEILDTLRHRSYFKEPVVEHGLIQIDYVNPNTRTLFAMTYESPEPETTDNSDTPRELRSSGLEFHMELPNSSWTAREAFSELLSIARSLRLTIQDVDASRGMQDENGKPSPAYFKPEGSDQELLRRWKRSCMHEIAFLQLEGTTTPHVPEVCVRRWWEYSSVEHLLETQVSSTVRVTPMFIAEHPLTKEAVTGIAWNGSPTIIPRCDIILILQSPRGFLSRLLRRVTASVMPYEETVTRLANFLQPLEGPPPLTELKLMTPEQAVKAQSAFAGLQGRCVDLDSFRYIHEEPFSDLCLRP